MDKVIIDFSEFANRGVGASPPTSTPRRKLLKRTQPLPGMATMAPPTPAAQLLDPEIQDMLSTPLLVPILQHFDQVKAKFDPIEKEINLLKRYRKNPLFFVRDELGIPIEAWRDDRPPKSWSPGNPVPLWSKQREILQALVDHRKVAVKSGHGVGKALYIHERVLVPNGWKEIGQLNIGDSVFSSDGTVSNVIGIFAQGIRDLYRVTLDDGCSLIVDGDHLWFTTTRSERKHGKNGKIRTTLEIMNSIGFPNGKVVGLNHQIPTTDMIMHPKRSLPVNPYTLGVWLGDGIRNTGEYSKPDPGVAENLQKLGECLHDYHPTGKCVRWRVLGLLPKLRNLGVLGTHSWERFVPSVYKYSSVGQRLAILQGLLDTDGTVGKENMCVEFSSTSKQLADDVSEIVRSLGGVVRRSLHQGKLNGVLMRMGFRCFISLPEGLDPFLSGAKLDKYKPKFGTKNRDRSTKRFIRSVEYFGKGEAVCIKVDHSSGLFVANDHIVTHNTFIAGLSAIYLAYVWHCVGLTTAPTFRQVRRALWGEIHWMFNNAKNPLGGKMNQVSLDLGDKWFVEGFATDKPMENITGIHEENIFVIVDEAGGVPDLTFEAIEGILTSENSFVLYIGNPINAEGPFADAFKPNSPFHKVTISCYDCPNVKYATNIYSKLTSYKWVKEKEVKWGINTNMFKVRVAGEFPDENKDTLIPMRYIESAQRRGQEEVMIPDRIIGFGLDVARQGSDSSVFGARYESGLFRILDVTNKKRETETAGQMKVLYNQLAPALLKNVTDVEKMLGKNPDKVKEEQEKDIIVPPINVDDIGVGGGVVDMLVEDEYPVNGINVGEKPDPLEDVTEKPELFLNKRAQYFWKLRTLFMGEKVAIEDDELAFELSKIRVEFLRSGKIKIIDKEILKKAPPVGIGRSPDRAECMMLTFAKDVAETSIEMVRFI